MLLVWVGILCFSVYPSAARFISTELHLGDNLNTLIFVGLAGLFYLNIQSLRMIELTRKDITRMVRSDALRSLDEEIKNRDIKKT